MECQCFRGNRQRSAHTFPTLTAYDPSWVNSRVPFCARKSPAPVIFACQWRRTYVYKRVAVRSQPLAALVPPVSIPKWRTESFGASLVPAVSRLNEFRKDTSHQGEVMSRNGVDDLENRAPGVRRLNRIHAIASRIMHRDYKRRLTLRVTCAALRNTLGTLISAGRVTRAHILAPRTWINEFTPGTFLSI